MKPFPTIPTLQTSRLVLRRITSEDAAPLHRLVHSPAVYRYEPTFLYERKYPDISRVIEGLYTECDSLILGVFTNASPAQHLEQHSNSGVFAGLAEFYGFRDEIHKISIGYRFLEDFWGRGIASETVGVMVKYLLEKTSIEIITASTMVENKASARVLMKNGFSLIVSGADEDWGFEEPTATDKWFL